MLASLEMREGEVTTAGAEAARAAGNVEHERFHRQVTQAHNRRDPTKKKGPCFVASVVYGVDDARTEELRRFRDSVLLKSVWTAWTVRAYYAASPPVAHWLAVRPWAAKWVAKCLDVVRAGLVRPFMGE
ncbi:hypothetical protein NB700_001844 [Xanthomonas sacchari]|uniref:Uncharacterized protein n=1 Tax=Xanthomonas sacchari TaxID=56458 RepID=A0ABT3DUW4_9XANT|nr:CFI-box-CTERM domain-containing protein [Xanthomonas sacchari]MCW0399288.1 hypothetical protein [Xanthomonas sacchari]